MICFLIRNLDIFMWQNNNKENTTLFNIKSVQLSFKNFKFYFSNELICKQWYTSFSCLSLSSVSPITAKSLKDQHLIARKLRSLRGIQKKPLLHADTEAFYLLGYHAVWKSLLLAHRKSHHLHESRISARSVGSQVPLLSPAAKPATGHQDKTVSWLRAG